MLERLSDLPANVVGIRASGTVTGADYHEVVRPLMQSARRDGQKLRMLYELGDDFDRFSLTGVVEDARSGLQGASTWQRIAVVTDAKLPRAITHAIGQLTPCSVRTFPSTAREQAVHWLARPPESRGLSHQTIADRGVVRVTLLGSVTAEDVEALQLAVDSLIDRRGSLEGLVLVCPALPSWANLGSFLGQLDFMQEHRGRVRRVGIVADGRLARLVVPMLGRWLDCEARRFPSGQLDAALAWAGADDGAERTRPDGLELEASDRVHEAGIESFPASDPPSYTPKAN